MEWALRKFTLMNPNEQFSQEDESGYTNVEKFRKLVGGLLYLTHTRPDIQFVVGVVSRFMQKPTEQHIGAIKRIMKYMSSTVSFGLKYKQVSNPKLVGYADNDYGGCVDDRRSTTGWIFHLGSAAISWCSKKQSVVALSITEVEYMAITSAACQATWLRRMLEEIIHKQRGATPIYCDNKSVILLAQNPIQHGQTKHIDVCFHFIRELEAGGTIQVIHCGTTKQLADFLTKSLPVHKHKKLREKIGMTEHGESVESAQSKGSENGTNARSKSIGKADFGSQTAEKVSGLVNESKEKKEEKVEYDSADKGEEKIN